MSIEFTCTHCGARFRTKPENAGKQARCGKCNQLTRIHSMVEAVEELRVERQITFCCSNCDSVFQTNETFIGRQTRCRTCNQMLTIRESMPPRHPAPSEVFSESHSDDDAPIKFIKSDDIPVHEVRADQLHAPAEPEELFPEDMLPVRRAAHAPDHHVPMPPAPEVVKAPMQPPALAPSVLARPSGGRASALASASMAPAKSGWNGQIAHVAHDRIVVGMIIAFALALLVSPVVLIRCQNYMELSGVWRFSSFLWPWALATLFLVFAVGTPVIVGGLFLTSWLFSFRFDRNTYLAAASLLSAIGLPALLFGLGLTLGSATVAILALVIALVVLCIYPKYLLEVTWGWYFGQTNICMYFVKIGMVVTGVLGVVVGKAFMPEKDYRRGMGYWIERDANGHETLVVSSTGEFPVRSEAGGSAASFIDAQKRGSEYTALCKRKTAIQLWVNHRQLRSRDTDKKLAELKTDVGAFISRDPGEPEARDLATSLSEFELTYNALEFDAPDDAILKPIDDGESWTLDGDQRRDLGPEIKVGADLAIRIPIAAPLDLEAFDGGRLVWRAPMGDARLTISSVPHSNPQQLRPWVVSPKLASKAEDSGLMCIVSRSASQSSGRISSMTFVRGQLNQGEGMQTADAGKIRYVALRGDHWLVADVTAEHLDDEWVRAFERAVRSLRPLTAGEMVPGPLDPQIMILRLTDMPHEAIERLVASGEKAEDPLLAMLEASDTAPKARAAALEALSKVATEKSKATLWRFASSEDPELCNSARHGLIRADPSHASAGSFALADLSSRSNDAAIRLRGATALANMKPESAMRDEVAKALWAVVSSKDQQDKALVENAAGALQAWSSVRTTDQVVVFLSSPDNADHPNLEQIIVLSGALKDKRIAFAATRWLIKSPVAVRAACIQIGQPAEAELLKLLSNRDDNIRSLVIDILTDVGGAKSIGPLDALSRSGSPAIQAKATAALREVKSRDKGK